MACARCDFFIPKPSSEAQLLEAKDGLQRMLLEIPLTDEERTAVEGDTWPSSVCLTGSPTLRHRRVRAHGSCHVI